MKKKNKEMLGIQMLSEYCGLDVTINPTMSFLALVCHCLSREEVKELFGLSNWEYNRIFKDDLKDGFRWIRSAKLAFKTMESHSGKRTLDNYQDELSFFLWLWIRDEYLQELAEELENVFGEGLPETLEDYLGFEVSKEELNDIGMLILLHLEETYQPEIVTA